MEDDVWLFLDAGPDDPPLRDAEYQESLRGVEQALRMEGVTCSPLVSLQKAVGGGEWYVGEFIIEIAKSGVPAALATAVGAWLHARYGRKARLKIGDIEAEARSVDEVEKLVKLAEKHRQLRDDR
jgi:hypothetical protein